MFAYLAFCLSVCLSVCLSDCLSTCLSACFHISLSVCLSACLPVCLSIFLSVALFICLTGRKRKRKRQLEEGSGKSYFQLRMTHLAFNCYILEEINPTVRNIVLCQQQIQQLPLSTLPVFTGQRLPPPRLDTGMFMHIRHSR